MTVPWRAGEALGAREYRLLRRRAIFECCKWDPQVEDVATLASFPLILNAQAWAVLSRSAERLAAETLAAEAELRGRPDLHADLGLPRALRWCWADGSTEASGKASLRIMRFDFHPTRDGWRVSEVNSDVPGGYNEASGFTALMAARFSPAQPAGDPAARLADALAMAAGQGGAVALVHATAYTDDRQVMVYLGRELQQRGVRARLVAPDHLRWGSEGAWLEEAGDRVEVGAMFRFFPAEWLPSLPRGSGWQRFVAGGNGPSICNPATALMTQSKRFPLCWDRLRTPLPTWREMLPSTRDPREVDWTRGDGWIVKPALGRVGEMIGMAGVTSTREWDRIRRSVWWRPGQWVAQQRFVPLPCESPQGSVHACVGVYVLDGRAVGIYGRLAPKPLIDHTAQDVAVLVETGDIGS